MPNTNWTLDPSYTIGTVPVPVRVDSRLKRTGDSPPYCTLDLLTLLCTWRLLITEYCIVKGRQSLIDRADSGL
jgi:hypothetical protein